MQSNKCTTTACTDIQAITYTGRGQVTFNSEGQEGGRYYSRYFHVPSNSSGLTIGRGYDMKEKNAATIKADLISIGIDEAQAAKISKAAGLHGYNAKKFIVDNDLDGFSITPTQQESLFKKSYDGAVKDVRRISDKDDVVKAYGSTNFETLHPAIQDILVDLRYRGDYTGATRKTIQPAVVKNDLKAFREAVANLKGVPDDRMKRRLEFLDAAIAEDAKKAPSGQPMNTLAGKTSISTPNLGTPPVLYKAGQVAS